MGWVLHVKLYPDSLVNYLATLTFLVLLSRRVIPSVVIEIYS